MPNHKINDLISTHYNYVYKFIYRCCRNRQLTEDIVQDTVEKVLMKHAQLDDYSKFRAWFCSIALNILRNDFRRSKWRELKPLSVIEYTPSNVDLERDYAYKEAQEKLLAKARTLPPRQRQAFNLRFLHELPLKDVAAHMGSGYDTAKANTRHAVQKIKRRSF